ncbi:MAG TPA: hypothetical protein VFH08_00390 [Chitinophagaceae bacterium]|nr:hypothetical protein [Chitinophagaceae bacterium]
MKRYDQILKGGDLRSIGKANRVVEEVNDQQTFDELFKVLYNTDRKVVMRGADAIEKITIKNPGYLQQHKDNILTLCESAKDIELKWHLALLGSRLELTKNEVRRIWQILKNWATDKKESKIVRVNSLQGLHNILSSNEELMDDFNRILRNVEGENIPSINARLRKLRHAPR